MNRSAKFWLAVMIVGLLAIAATVPIGKEFSWDTGEAIGLIFGLLAFFVGLVMLVRHSLNQLALPMNHVQRTTSSTPMRAVRISAQR